MTTPDRPRPMAEMVDYVACRLGEPRRHPEMERQAAAGEEDQSVPGWDQGA